MSGSDDLGGLGDLDDGGEDLGGLDGDEELGGLDDGFDDMDGGDEMAGGGGGNVDELEHRLDELENEVGNLSSTVNTVRNENEQISNSVEEVEENVRKLLDIYEMVTRGVNPFADEMDGGMGMGGGGQMDAQDSSFGLFTDEEEEEEEDVDEDIAEADAEGFFDDDLVEDEEDDVDEEIDAEMGDVFEDDTAETDDEEFDDVGGEFDDAAEFEEVGDDEEFDDVGGDFDEEAEFDDVGGDEEFEDAGGEFDTEGTDEAVEPDAGFDDVADGMADDDLFDETASTADQAGQTDPDHEPAANRVQETTQPTETTASSQEAGKPYLSQVPDGLTGDLVVIEWLEYLVDELGARGASEAVRYYETIDWITEKAADQLEAHLGEFEAGERGSLSVEHHRQSLDYIDQLNGGDATQQASVFGGGDSL